jgi:hypothetical protein
VQDWLELLPIIGLTLHYDGLLLLPNCEKEALFSSFSLQVFRIMRLYELFSGGLVCVMQSFYLINIYRINANFNSAMGILNLDALSHPSIEDMPPNRLLHLLAIPL